MTPAILAARKSGIEFKLHEYKHDPKTQSYGKEAADALGLEAPQVFKTLIAEVDASQWIVAVIPVDRQLNLKAVAAAMKTKKATMAKAADAERTTGYLLGGISPLGQKKRLPTLIDQSALDFETIYVSAGKRGLEMELPPESLVESTHAKVVQIAR